MNEQNIEKLHLCIVNVKELILLAKEGGDDKQVRVLRRMLGILNRIEKRAST